MSANDFVSCAGFASAAPELSDGNSVATLVPVPGLLVNRVYKIRVTTAVAGATSADRSAIHERGASRRPIRLRIRRGES